MTPLVTAATIAGPAVANVEAASDGWTYALMPQLGLPTAKLDLSFDRLGCQSTDISVSSNDYLGEIGCAFFIASEPRKERWLVATDFLYLNLGGLAFGVNFRF